MSYFFILLSFLLLLFSPTWCRSPYDEQLILAAKDGRIEDVRIYISSGANVNYRTRLWQTPLYFAVYNNREDVVKYLLENGADPKLIEFSALNVQWPMVKLLLNAGINPSRGSPPLLTVAVQANNFDMVRYLVSKGANIDTFYKQKTPLIEALERNNSIISKFLIDSGADINTGFDYQTPLDLAFTHNLSDIVNLLVEKGANIRADTLMFLIDKTNLQMIKYLAENGANVNKLGRNGETPLSYAIRTGKNEIVEWLLENGAQFSVHSALSYAIDTENITVIKLLIQKGSELNLQRKKIHTPLVKAIQLKNFEVVKELAGNGADVNLTSLGVSPLIEAIELNQADVVKYLVEQGADPNLRDGKGNLPLIKAIELRQLETVQKLINKSVDVNSSDGNGKTPLIRALEIGDEQITKILLQQETNLTSNSTLISKQVQNKNLKAVELLLKGKDDLLDAVGDDGYTPLTKSAKADDYKMLEFLVKRGANVNVVDGNRNTALSLAASNRNFQMIEYLLSHGAALNVGKGKLEEVARTDDDFGVYLERALKKKQQEEKVEVSTEETKKRSEQVDIILGTTISSVDEDEDEY